jgi:hypothetical protein
MRLSVVTPVLTRVPGAHARWEEDAGVAELVEIARAADRLGYHHLTCSEHVAEQPADRSRLDPYLRWRHDEHLGRLVTAPGVAGAWVFATAARYRRGRYTEGDYRITVCFLDGDPSETANGLGRLMEEAWHDAPVTPLLAAPFASLVPWIWPDGIYQ